MISVIDGPSVVSGNTNPVQNLNTDQGPSLAFQGSGLTDPRFVGQIGGAPGTPIYGLYANSYVASSDTVPVVLSNTRVSAAQATAAGVAMALVTAQGVGVSPNIPLVPMGVAPTPENVVKALCLDYGFTACSVVAGTKTMTIPAGAWRLFTQGAKICVSGALTANTPLFTTVAAAVAPGTTTITMADNAGVTANNVQVGDAHPAANINASWPYLKAGVIALFDPTEGTARAVSVTGNAGALAGNFTVRGYDIYGQAMTEVIAFAGGAVTTAGKKAFKFIVSVTPSVTDAGHLMSIGTTDVLGFNVRSDFWEYNNIFVAGAFVTVNTGWLAADAASATGSTGDVRGTYALQTPSNWDGTVANWPTSRRVAIFSSLPVYNCVGATNLNYSTMYGNTNFAG